MEGKCLHIYLRLFSETRLLNFKSEGMFRCSILIQATGVILQERLIVF